MDATPFRSIGRNNELSEQLSLVRAEAWQILGKQPK
jgi:hypothetical protein